MLRALRHRGYRLFVGAGLVSVTGTWMQVVAQNWLVLRLSGRVTAVGAVVALQALPSVALSLLGGSIADRLPKRSLLVATQVALAALAFALGIATVTGVVTLPMVYGLALALGLVLAVDGPANAAFGAELVHRDDVPNAVALGSVANSLGRIAGMGLAGVLVGSLGEGAIFVINGVSYLAVVAALCRIDVARHEPAEPPSQDGASVRSGLRVALRSQTIVVATLVAFVVAAFGRNYQVTMAAMSRSVFGTGARGYGQLSAVFAAGAFCGGLAAAVVRRHTLRLVVLIAAAAGVLQLTSAVAPSFRSFALCIYPIAVTAVVFDTAALSVVQLAVDDTHRARSIAVLSTASMLGTTAGGPALGWLADHLGARASLGLGSMAVLAATLGVAAVAQRSRIREDGLVRALTGGVAGMRLRVASEG